MSEAEQELAEYEWPKWDDEVGGAVDYLEYTLKKNKPGDRSEVDRRFAIAITETEKLRAYLEVFLLAPQIKDLEGD